MNYLQTRLSQFDSVLFSSIERFNKRIVDNEQRQNDQTQNIYQNEQKQKYYSSLEMATNIKIYQILKK